MNNLTFLKALSVEQKIEEEMMFSNATETAQIGLRIKYV